MEHVSLQNNFKTLQTEYTTFKNKTLYISDINPSKINPQNRFEEKITFYKSFIGTNYEAIIKNAINLVRIKVSQRIKTEVIK